MQKLNSQRNFEVCVDQACDSIQDVPPSSAGIVWYTDLPVRPGRSGACISPPQAKGIY